MSATAQLDLLMPMPAIGPAPAGRGARSAASPDVQTRAGTAGGTGGHGGGGAAVRQTPHGPTARSSEKISAKNFSESEYQDRIAAARDAWTKEHGTVREFYAALAQRDLYFLCKWILGYRKLVWTYHWQTCVLCADPQRRRQLWLEPRGWYKSTIKTIARIVQRTLASPEIAILCITGTAKLSEDILREVKGHFLETEALLELFPEWRLKRGEEGTLTEMTLPCRRTPQREPTVRAATTGTSLTGYHFDVIHADDLINEKNCTTREQIQESVDWFRRSFPLLRDRAKGDYVVCGTRYDYADVHAHILEEHSTDNGGDFHCFVQPAEVDGVPTHPEIDDAASLATARQNMGAAQYSAQMNQQPTSEHQRVDPSWFQYHDDDEATIRAGHAYLLTDAAYSQRDQADYVALVVALATADGYWDVLEYTREHLNPRQFLNRIWHYWDKYKPLSPLQAVTVQQATLDQVLAFFLTEDMAKRNEYLPLVPIAVHGKDKTRRIARAVTRLQPAIGQTHGRLRWRRGMYELEDEFLKYPKSPHDDLTDALSDMAEVGHAPVAVIAPPKAKPIAGLTIQEAYRILGDQLHEHDARQARSIREEEVGIAA